MLDIILCFVILAFAVVMFITDLIPAGVTAMAVTIALVLTGILTPAQGFAGFANSSVVLFVSMFIVGGALFHTGIVHQIAQVVTRFTKTERQLIMAVFVIGGLMSSVLPNLGTLAVLMPITIGIAGQAGCPRTKLLLPLCYGTTVGGMVTMLGNAGNVMAATMLEESCAIHLSFFDFSKYGLPMLIACTAYYWLIGYKRLPVHEVEDSLSAAGRDGPEAPKWKRWMAAAVLCATVASMIFDVGISIHVAAAAGALVLVVTRTVSEDEALAFVNWKTIFLIAGMLPMATALDVTGAGELVADGVVGLSGGALSPVMLTAVLWLLSNPFTQFMSNTATTMILIPLGISIAQRLDANPAAVVLAVLVGSCCAFCTPIGQGTNTMIYEAGGYGFMDYVKNGWPVTLICFAVSMVCLHVFFPFY